MITTRQFKYMASDEQDLLWGLTVDNVGHAEVSPDFQSYPPDSGHPFDYAFHAEKRRTLQNYQLVYISRGRGEYRGRKETVSPLSAGDMMIIPPYTPHCYLPDKRTGWKEYWIGMRGPSIDAKFRNGFFSPHQTIYKVGIREDLVQLYNQAIAMAFSENATGRQIMSGIGELILGLSRHYDRNQYYPDDILLRNMDRARLIMRENVLKGISPREVAEQINMGYSLFRRVFKQYMNVSPGHFMLELKLQNARHRLLSTVLTVKEIAHDLGYEDSTCFISVFKKYTGYTPMAYREEFSAPMSGAELIAVNASFPY